MIAVLSLSDLMTPLALFGFAGQAAFMMRFVIQWYVSEKKRRSHVPLAFWYFSLLGGVMLLTYATLRRDPVFMFGQALGLTIYIRNLVLIYRRRARIRARSARQREVQATADSADVTLPRCPECGQPLPAAGQLPGSSRRNAPQERTAVGDAQASLGPS